MQKLLHVCGLEGVSEEFMMWNDDFFLQSDIDTTTYKNLYKWDLKDEVILFEGMPYQEYLKDTIEALKDVRMPTFNFDVHAPIRYSKCKFAETMGRFDFNKRLLVKSIYGNRNLTDTVSQYPQTYFYVTGGAPYSDCKIKRPMMLDDFLTAIAARHIFSIGDGALENNTVKDYLQAMFPLPSHYENVTNNN
jgi:hypothetical protein